MSLSIGMMVSAPSPVAADPVGSGIVLVVVAGQSNAVSRAPDGDLSRQIPVPGIDQVARVTAAPIIPAYEPLQHWDMTPNGIGFGFEFAKRYKKDHPSTDIIIVPSAKGETGLGRGEWGAGGFLSNDLIARVNKVASERSIRDCIFLWHQGENEVVRGSQSYASDLFAAFEAMRAEAPILRNCAFFVGGLADDFVAAYGENAAKVMADLKSTEGTAFVSAEGLGTMDGVHFTADSQIELGAWYYEAARQLSED